MSAWQKWRRKEIELSYKMTLPVDLTEMPAEGAGCMAAPRAILPMLDCLYCQMHLKDFQLLASHVVTEHNPQGYSQSERRKRAMALPKPSGEAKQYNEWLTAKDFGKKDFGTLTFLGVREAPRGAASDVFVDVKIGKVSRTWGLKADSRNYAALVSRFGTKEEKWTGKVDVVIVHKGEKSYINLAE